MANPSPIALALCLILVSASRIARAEPPSPTPSDVDGVVQDAPRWTHPRLAVMAHVGLGTPYGGLGVAADTAVFDWLSVEAGVGTNLQGVEVGVMPRLGVGLGRGFRLSLAGGVSVGRFEASCGEVGANAPMCALGHGNDASVEWQPAWWRNIDLSLEHANEDGGLRWRWYQGFGSLMNPGAGACARPGSRGCAWATNVHDIYLGFAMGWGVL